MPAGVIKPGPELGYAQITGTISTTSTTAVDATGLTTTVITGSRPIVIEAFSFWLTNSADQGVTIATIMEDGTQIQEGVTTASGIALASQGGETLLMSVRRNPSVGSHTYKMQYWTNAAGTAGLWAASTAPAFITVREV